MWMIIPYLQKIRYFLKHKRKRNSVFDPFVINIEQHLFKSFRGYYYWHEYWYVIFVDIGMINVIS